MMRVIFAASRADAQEFCAGLGLKFESVVWVMNDQLLGDVIESEVVPYYTEMFREAPAFAAAAARFGDSPGA